MQARNEQVPDLISTLPDELLLEILKNIEASNSMSVALTSSIFSRIWQDEKIWQNAVMKDFPRQFVKLQTNIRHQAYAIIMKNDLDKDRDDAVIQKTCAMLLSEAFKHINWKAQYVNLKSLAYVNIPENQKNAIECVRQGKAELLVNVDLNWKLISSPDKTGESVLSLCCSNGDEKTLQLLFDRLVLRSDSTLTPLHFAMECRQDAKAAELIESGIDLQIDPAQNDEPYLFTALGTGALATCELLLSHGADTEAIGADGDTVLCAAASEDKLEFVELLLRKGADVTACGNGGEGYNVLSCALRHRRVVEFLVQTSAVDINAYDARGYTCLHNAISIYSTLNPNDYISRYNIIKNIEYLLEHGADPRLESMGEEAVQESALVKSASVLPTAIHLKMAEKASQLDISETANAALGVRRRRD